MLFLKAGARLGKVSCYINEFLSNKKNHVVIEPHLDVIPILEKNKQINNAQFHICTDILGNGNDKFNLNANHLGTYTKQSSDGEISTITYMDLCNRYNLNFNVLVIDCEGCIEYVIETNPDILKNKRMIMIEKDRVDTTNYQKVKNSFKQEGLIEVTRPYAFQQIWMNKNLF